MHVVHVCSHVLFLVNVAHIFVMVHIFTHLPFWWYLVVHVCVCCPCMCMWCMYADICSLWCMYMYVRCFFLVDEVYIFVMVHVFIHTSSILVAFGGAYMYMLSMYVYVVHVC